MSDEPSHMQLILPTPSRSGFICGTKPTNQHLHAFRARFLFLRAPVRAPRSIVVWWFDLPWFSLVMHRQARPIRQPETLPSTTHDERLGRHRFKQLDKRPNMYIYIYISPYIPWNGTTSACCMQNKNSDIHCLRATTCEVAERSSQFAVLGALRQVTVEIFLWCCVQVFVAFVATQKAAPSKWRKPRNKSLETVCNLFCNLCYANGRHISITRENWDHLLWLQVTRSGSNDTLLAYANPNRVGSASLPLCFYGCFCYKPSDSFGLTCSLLPPTHTLYSSILSSRIA